MGAVSGKGGVGKAGGKKRAGTKRGRPGAISAVWNALQSRAGLGGDPGERLRGDLAGWRAEAERGGGRVLPTLGFKKEGWVKRTGELLDKGKPHPFALPYPCLEKNPPLATLQVRPSQGAS